MKRRQSSLCPMAPPQLASVCVSFEHQHQLTILTGASWLDQETYACDWSPAGSNLCPSVAYLCGNREILPEPEASPASSSLRCGAAGAVRRISTSYTAHIDIALTCGAHCNLPGTPTAHSSGNLDTAYSTVGFTNTHVSEAPRFVALDMHLLGDADMDRMRQCELSRWLGGLPSAREANAGASPSE